MIDPAFRRSGANGQASNSNVITICPSRTVANVPIMKLENMAHQLNPLTQLNCKR